MTGGDLGLGTATDDDEMDEDEPKEVWGSPILALDEDGIVS